MFKIDKGKIYISRGDSGTINIHRDTPFAVGDTFRLSIMEKGDYNHLYFQKKYTVTEESTTFALPIESDDTRFCPITSEPLIFWYELEYNDSQTVIGYDKSGGKVLTIYPEAPDKED